MSRKDSERVVVTGMGVVSPLGCDLESFHDALGAGRCATAPVEPKFPTGYRQNLAGQVHGFDLARFGAFAVVDDLGRTAQLALAAARMALDHGNLGARAEHCGVVVGSAMGEGLELEAELEAGDGDRCAFGAPRLDDKVAQGLGLEGPRHFVATTCASGNHAIDWAAQLIRTGRADAMLAVGADTIGHVDLLGFSRLLLQAPDRCRPFDLRRKGTILSEGSGAVLLERADTARRRGAEILAEVAGCGLSCDAGGAFKSEPTDVRTLLIAGRAAFRQAGLSPDAVGYVSAHGSGTKLNDARETRFAKALFGDRAGRVPMSSIKSMLGHAQGAAASFECIASVLMIRHGVLYPTIHLETPDPECDLDYVPNEVREQPVAAVLSNAFGVGGNNSIVILTRCDP